MEEPKNVEKVVEENRLGDFVQAYDFSESKEKQFWGLLALFVVAWIIISDPWIKFTCIVMFLFLIARLFMDFKDLKHFSWRLNLMRRWQIRLYREGWIRQEGQQIDVNRYDDIISVREEGIATKQTQHKGAQRVTCNYLVVVRGKEPIRFGSSILEKMRFWDDEDNNGSSSSLFVSLKQIGDHLQNEVLRRKFDATMAAYYNGEILDFGSIKITPEGLVGICKNKEKMTPWSEVRRINLKRRNVYHIYVDRVRNEGWRGAIYFDDSRQVPIAEIPNLKLFLAVGNQICQADE